jgi:hypothetical protein
MERIMSENLILGCGTMVVCVTIQCIVVSILLRILITLEKRGIIRPTPIITSFLLITAMLIMVAGNLWQITLWSGLFIACGEFEGFATAFYHSVVNFSTLGYGDLVMSEERRLLGGLEATNGVLMFGLTTSVLFALLSALVRRARDKREDRDTESSGSLTR